MGIQIETACAEHPFYVAPKLGFFVAGGGLFSLGAEGLYRITPEFEAGVSAFFRIAADVGLGTSISSAFISLWLPTPACTSASSFLGFVSQGPDLRVGAFLPPPSPPFTTAARSGTY